MVFCPKDGHVFKLRVADNAGHSGTFSTGTTDEGVAQDVERMVQGFRAQRKWAYLTAIATKQAKLPAVYDAFVSGTIEEFMGDILATAADVDLQPFVAEWAKKANAKYVRQVRRLIGEGERFSVSRFRRKVVSKFLADLKCSGPTKNRYRAALSVLAKWLIENEVIDGNPVRDVAMQKEHDPRMVWMTWKDAQRVAEAAREPYRQLFYVMAATGIELGAALTLTREDVDVKAKTIHAHGTKKKWRNRVVRYEDFAADYIAFLVRGVGAMKLFPGMRGDDALDEFKAAQAIVGLSGHRLHDLRHTYAVNALKKGYKDVVVAHQLGHKDSTEVKKVYGRFIPDASDYVVTTEITAKKRGTR